MKHILTIVLAIGLILSAPATFAQKVYSMGTNVQDTALGNATKKQTTFVGSQAGITITVAIDHVTDTATGYVSLWGSTDGTAADYVPVPGADSVAITYNGAVRKAWLVGSAAGTIPISRTNPFKYYQVRTRLVSNTTNASSKVYVRSRLLTY